jgi:hypothetical protein
MKTEDSPGPRAGRTPGAVFTGEHSTVADADSPRVFPGAFCYLVRAAAICQAATAMAADMMSARRDQNIADFTIDLLLH